MCRLAIDIVELGAAFTEFQSKAGFAREAAAEWVLDRVKSMAKILESPPARGRAQYSIGDVAEILGVSSRTVLRAVQNGTITSFRYSARSLVIEFGALKIAYPDEFANLVAPPEAPPQDIYDPKAVARIFGAPTCAVRRAIKEGRLPVLRENRKVIQISRAAVLAWRDQCRIAAMVRVTDIGAEVHHPSLSESLPLAEANRR